MHNEQLLREKLLQTATKAREHAYAPYSRFKVGAALLDDEGRLYHGFNIENSSYGATICAERTALQHALIEGAPIKRFKMLAVVADTEDAVTPCGICRQVMAELCPPDLQVIMGNLQGKLTMMTVAELLPLSFALEDKKRDEE